MRLLVVGASGMIGSTIFRLLSEKLDWSVYGSIRNNRIKKFFSPDISSKLISGIDVEHPDSLVKLLEELRPDVVVNCVGLTKHRPNADDPLVSVPLNSLMPHRLAWLCKLVQARLIHISTDCVFSGSKGNYCEDDPPDARDVYGKSKE